jgi:hypothetical protein
LSGLGRRIGDMIGRARELVDQALTWLVNRAVDTAMGLIDRLMAMGRAAVSAVTGWARRLLGLEKRFQAEDGSPHRLYFAQQGENVVLMINPVPAGAFEQWVDSIVIDTSTAAGARRNTQRINARLKARAIDAKKAEVVTATTDPEKTRQETAKRDEIRRMLDELSELTGPLFAGQRPLCAREGSGIEFPEGNEGNYGKYMTARYLTNNRPPDGSTPNVPEPNSYQIINRRRYDGGSFYVKGHLLNHNLGGTGTDWKNLTPLTGIANGIHERTVEARVKTAVDAGNIVFYSVRAVYGRSVATSTDPDIQEIMNEEQHVPLRLVCQADLVTLGPDGRTPASTAPLVPAGTIIPNTVDQSPAAYQLVARRRQPVYLDSRTISELTQVTGVDATFARKIMLAYRQKAARDETRFPSLVALRDFVFNDGSSFDGTQKAVFNQMATMNHVFLYSVT